jgi:hypothetical protein
MHEHVHCIAACRLAAYDDIQMCNLRFFRVTKSPIFKLSARLSMTEATAVIARGIGKPDLRYEQFPYDEVQQELTQHSSKMSM